MSGIEDLMVVCGGVRYRKEDATALGLKSDAEVVAELAAIQAAADAAAAAEAAAQADAEAQAKADAEAQAAADAEIAEATQPEAKPPADPAEEDEPPAGTLTSEKARPARNKARTPQNKG